MIRYFICPSWLKSFQLHNIILLTFPFHKPNSYHMAHTVYTGGDHPSKNKSLLFYRFIDSANSMTSLPIMLTKLFYLKLQMLSNYWSAHILGIKLMYLCDCGQSLCLSLLAQIHTSTLTHTHNTMLHCHWHTFPEANPVDRSHRVNPLSEQWFPQCKKTSNPLRSENNKLIKLYLLKNKKMYDTKHDFWCNMCKNWMWFIISNLYGFFAALFHVITMNADWSF